MTTKFSILAAALCCALVTSARLFAASGDLDPSFGGGAGYVTTKVEGHASYGTSMAVQSDGKILVSGATKNKKTGYAFTIVRFNVDGSLDTTFSGDGAQVVDLLNFNAQTCALAVRRDGGIVLAGASDGGSIGLVLLLPNGNIDTRFGQNGALVIKIENVYLWAGSVALQSDGKILVGGEYIDFTRSTTKADVMRFLGNGAPDTSFGHGGILLESNFREVDAIGIGSGAKIVFAGTDHQANLFVSKLNSDSSRDLSFGTNGAVTILYPNQSVNFSRMTIIASDNILVSSLAFRSGAPPQVILTQLNSDGSYNLGFGTGGTVLRPEMTDFASTAVDRTGRIIITGGGDHTYTDPSGSYLLTDIVLNRVDSAGNADTTFGTLGFVDTFLQQNASDYPFSTAIQTDGKILVAANIETTATGSIGVFRYLP